MSSPYSCLCRMTYDGQPDIRGGLVVLWGNIALPKKNDRAEAFVNQYSGVFMSYQEWDKVANSIQEGGLLGFHLMSEVGLFQQQRDLGTENMINDYKEMLRVDLVQVMRNNENVIIPFPRRRLKL